MGLPIVRVTRDRFRSLLTRVSGTASAQLLLGLTRDVTQADKRKDFHQSMSIIPEHSLDILQSTALAYLATIGPKGEPQVSAVWFGCDGTHLLFSMNKVRQKYQNLLREPRVAIALADPANPYRSLEIRGTVTRIDEDLNYRFSNSLSQKYLHRDVAPDERRPGEERVVIVIEPKHVVVFPFQEDKK
jgi:PPOX class probable F420-dependent enzyme